MYVICVKTIQNQISIFVTNLFDFILLSYLNVMQIFMTIP